MSLLLILSNIGICLHAFLHGFCGIPMEPWITDVTGLGLSVVFTLLLLRPYRNLARPLMNGTNSPRVWWATVLFSAAIFTVNMLLIPVEKKSARDTAYAAPLLLILLLLLFLHLMMGVLFQYIVSELQAKAEAEARSSISSRSTASTEWCGGSGTAICPPTGGATGSA